MTASADLFPGFAQRRITTSGADIFVCTGGSGPPLLLLHGYPQTHVCWHRIAPALAENFQLVVMDLRGYGASSGPSREPDGPADHAAYSKRAMALDCIEVMRELGHARFAVAGHDRGGRVAYRLALDHPNAITQLIVLDILPTIEVWEGMNWSVAVKSYHWPFLAQPFPLPERLIAGDPDFYAEHTIASWTRSGDLTDFNPQALECYRELMRNPASVHAICEDYRAGATIDRDLDLADRQAGRRIAAPTLTLWGTDYVGRSAVGPLDVWRNWCETVEGQSVLAGHFLAEEAPEATCRAMLEFLDRQART